MDSLDFLGFGFRIFGLLVFLRIVVDRDVKMGFSMAEALRFRCSALLLRCLVVFAGFWYMADPQKTIKKNRRPKPPVICFNYLILNTGRR